MELHNTPDSAGEDGFRGRSRDEPRPVTHEQSSPIAGGRAAEAAPAAQRPRLGVAHPEALFVAKNFVQEAKSSGDGRRCTRWFQKLAGSERYQRCAVALGMTCASH